MNNRRIDPSMDDIYSFGQGGGSRQSKMFCQNFDFAGFIPLVKEVYSTMKSRDYYFPRKLPFCVFQHAMTEVLTARMLALSEERYDGAFLFTDCWIPLPIYSYIEGIGRTLGSCGTHIDWNLPKAAVPQNRIKGEKPCRSGTFGIPTAASHNTYECYVSPYITSEYVKRQAEVTEETSNLSWNPFPNGWLPAESEINENLLGYHPLQKLRLEELNICLDCTFADNDDTIGMLCHSGTAVSRASSVVAGSSIRSKKAQFPRRPDNTGNLAAFIFKELNMREDLKAVLWKEPSSTYSPFAMSAYAVNKGSCCGYKRKRYATAPGIFALCNGQPIDGWLETINDNFECTGLFGLRAGHDKKDLRDAEHRCDTDEYPNSLRNMIDRSMI